MKRIKIKPITPDTYDFRFWDDCERIVKVFHNEGYSISLTEARTLWERYSEEAAASWIYLPEDGVKIFDCLREYWNDID